MDSSSLERFLRASRSFGQKIRLRLFNRGQIFSPKNFQLTLGFEKRTGKRAILKEKKKEIEEIDVKISTKGGILRSNGTKILRETYENCRTMMLYPPIVTTIQYDYPPIPG